MQNRQIRKTEENKKFERVPVSGLRDILTVYDKDPNFHYRFVEDKDESGSRILKFKRGGYDFADSSLHEVGQESVYKSKKGESIVRVPTGGGKFSYLMRIKKEWYEEDQRAKASKIDEIESVIKRTGTTDDKNFGQYGDVKISRD